MWFALSGRIVIEVLALEQRCGLLRACASRPRITMALLPVLVRAPENGLDIKKDGQLFGEDRQLGLGWEQHYNLYFNQGCLEAGSLRTVSLRGGRLLRKSGGRWRNVSDADVPLTEFHQEFLTERVKADHALLTKVGFCVTGVDVKRQGVDKSDDLRGFFWRETPVRGICALEHKFVFGRARAAFKKRLDDHKKDALERFLARSDGTRGQLLLVAQVSGSSRPAALATKLFYYDGSACCEWGEIMPNTFRAAQMPTFDQVWAKCEQLKANNSKVHVAAVSEFLGHVGEDGDHTLQKIKAWTARGARLGVKRRQFMKARAKSGSGPRSRWAASRATMYKVWPALRARYSRARSF